MVGPAGVGSLGRTGQPPDAHTPPPLPPGLCGNFNQNQADDFLTISGVVEGSAAAFANTWKTQAACPNVKNSFEDPCSLSVENGVCPAALGPAWCLGRSYPALLHTEELGVKESRSPRGGSRLT